MDWSLLIPTGLEWLVYACLLLIFVGIGERGKR